jgi:hypothetical protein
MKNIFFLVVGFMFVITNGCVKNESAGATSKTQKDDVFINTLQKYPNVVITPYVNQEIELRTNDCRPNSGGDDCFEYTVSNFPVDMDGCEVLVSVNVMVCRDPITGDVIFAGFWGFNYTMGSGPDCISFVQEWSDLYMDLKYTDLYTSMNTFYKQLTRKFELEFISTLSVQIFNCPSYTNLGQFYEADCQQLCATLVNSTGEPFYNLSRVKCGNGCCRRTTAYCRRPNGTLEQIVTGAGPWTNPPCDPVTVICNGTIVPVVGCQDPCERI